jgi:hypothetical protein
MSRRAATLIASSLWLFVLVFIAAYFNSIEMSGDWYLLSHPRSAASAEEFGAALVFAVFAPALILAYATVGAVVASLRLQNGVGWLCLGAGSFAVLSAFLFWLADRMDLAFLVNLQSSLSFVPLMVPLLAVTLMLLIFPTGRLPSRRWRIAVWMALAGTGLVTIADSLPNFYSGVEAVGAVGGVASLTALVASASAVVFRWRTSRGQERQQLKWLVYTLAVTIVAGLCALASWHIQGDIPGARSYSTVIALVVALAGLMVGIPVAIGIAVLRYRLYDIDRIINRTLVYGALTTLLVLVYIGGVTTTQAIFRALTSQEKQPQLAIVVSTLAIAALFNPSRRRIQTFIDRRFYRRKYDARKTLEAFSAKLRDETDLDALSEDLVGVIRETMQPAHVSLWLRPDTVSSKGQQTD